MSVYLLWLFFASCSKSRVVWRLKLYPSPLLCSSLHFLLHGPSVVAAAPVNTSMIQVRRNRGRKQGWCLHQGIRDLLRHSWKPAFTSLTCTVSQCELFSGQAVRKGEFEFLSAIVREEKELRLKWVWVSQPMLLFTAGLSQNFSSPSSAKIYSRHQTAVNSWRERSHLEMVIWGGSYIPFPADYEIWKWR